MSTVVKKRESLFSKKNRKLITDPLDINNPVTIQVLGICSALAVTIQLEPTVYMAVGLTLVTAFANLIISLIRNFIPNRIRIIVQLVVVAGLVSIVDQVLQAYAFEISKKLSVFVGLIVTNCIVMGRLEAFAMSNKPWASFLDGLGNGFGYAVIILAVAFLRELLGFGELYGFDIIARFGYQGNGLMLTPAGAAIVLGVIIWIQRARNGYVESE